MKRTLGRLADRVLSRLRLGFDFSMDLHPSLFNEIAPTLYLGARPSRANVRELKGVGVTHVVSCLAESQRARMRFLRQDFHHLFLGVHDGMHEDIERTFSQFFDFAEGVTAHDPTAKLFVHCEVGVSRSATLAIALLMKTEGLSFFDAVRRVRSKRIQILPNIGFASQLQRLEHELQPHSVTRIPSSLALYLREVCNAPVEIEVLQSVLEHHGFDAPAALRTIFGGDIPRVVQGVRT